MKREAALPTPRWGAYAHTIGVGALLVYALLFLVGAAFWKTGTVQSFLSNTVLLSASFVAIIACFTAWRSIARPMNVIWLVLGVAAAVATASRMMTVLPFGHASAFAVESTWLLSSTLLLVAVVIAVHSAEGGRVGEFALDVALVITAASLVIVRWAPGAQTVPTIESPTALLLVVFGPVVGLTGLLLIAVLGTSRQGEVASGALNGIAAAIGCLALSIVPQMTVGSACCQTGSWTIFPAIGTWVFIIYAATEACASGDVPLIEHTGERLRQIVAPTVALTLGIVSLQAAVDPPLSNRTGFALGVLGALVALRMTQLLQATRLQVVERRELAQTRALVEVSRALAGKNDLDATLKTVTHWAARVLNARAAAVELLSSDGTTLELRAAEGLPDSAIGMVFPVDASFTGWVVLNGEPRITANASHDPYVSAETLLLVGDSPMAAVPLRYRERLLGVVSCIGNQPFSAADIDLLRAFASQTALALEDARLFEQVRALSITDPLTGLANRRQLDREATREFAAAQRGRKLVAVMFDLDDFKQHNDKYGHIAGDEALRHFAEALQSTTRTMNLAARFGGDEFLALLADTDERGAEVFVGRVKDRFRRAMDGAGWPVIQVSAGVAEYNDQMRTPEDLIAAADRALYSAKFEAEVSA